LANLFNNFFAFGPLHIFPFAVAY